MQMGCVNVIGVSRFLDLPPELRNRVYNILFEDRNGDEIPLLGTRQCRPSTAITVVCQQLRRETLRLCKEARASFFQNHTFCIVIDRNVGTTLNLENIITKLSRNVAIHKLAFIVTDPIDGIEFARIEARTSGQQEIEWSTILPPVTASRTLLENYARLMTIRIRMVMSLLRWSLLKEQLPTHWPSSDGLRLEFCVKVVCSDWEAELRRYYDARGAREESGS